MKCCWEYWCCVWQAKRGHKISVNVSVYGWEALLGCMSWSQAGDPEVMAGFLPKSSSWPVTLLLSAPGLISAASKWFVILFKDNYWWWPHSRPPNSFHLCPPPNLIPKVESLYINTRWHLLPFSSSVKSVYLKISHRKDLQKASHTQSSH